MGVLIFVQKSNVQATPRMISSFFDISKPSVTDMVNSLVKKDLLIKIQSEVDRRSYSLVVTKNGSELLESTYKDYFKVIEVLGERMGNEDFKLFIQLLQKANNILSEERKL
jgi:DNA-binding MarR family transcriptional regulator